VFKTVRLWPQRTVSGRQEEAGSDRLHSSQSASCLQTSTRKKWTFNNTHQHGIERYSGEQLENLLQRLAHVNIPQRVVLTLSFIAFGLHFAIPEMLFRYPRNAFSGEGHKDNK